MRAWHTLIAVWCVSGGLGWMAGCGDDTGGPADGSGDVTVGDVNNPPDAAKDTGGNDGGSNDSGGNDGGGNDGGGNDGGGNDATTGLSFVCPVDGGTVTNCAQCSGSPEPCVYCLMTDASVLTGQCVAMGTSCGPAAPNNYQRCPCTNDAAVCPEAYQVCRTGSCRTCAESTNNNGYTCKSGGICDNVDGGCI